MAAQGNHMDIIEMDAASNRGIDDIKDLIEHTKYKPSAARYKIFIIDEVHMLTNQAFNALLKTLEEPPDFVKFILATTDPLKLPATILSRTQHFRFIKIAHPLVVKHLEHILNLENIGFEQDAIEILARSGAGSLRDSLTLTDQAIVYSKNFVDVATVTGMLGIIEPSHLEALLADIMAKDRSKILAFIAMARNYEAEMILDEFTLYLKDLLLSNDATLSPMIIERFFRVIAESKSLLALGSDGEFVLTLALFKMMESLQIKEIDSMIRGLENELKGVEVSEIVVTTPTQKPTPPTEVITITQEEIDSIATPTIAIKEEPSVASVENRTAVKDDAFQEEKEAHISEPSVAQELPTQAQKAEESRAEISTPKKRETQAPQHKTFQSLIQKIYDRDYDLGVCFEENITFVSYAEEKLTWESTANEEDRKQLITHWGLINMFVKELFGFETKIVNIPKKKVTPPKETPLEPSTTELQSVEIPTHNDANSSSMIEEVEMKSSCIAPEAGETEAAKEKDPSTLLDEPMVKEAIALFDPKKVRIKKNV
jgi:DNA polymerase-3 subunit gamma/tau